jgi:hypothetical protein
MGRRHALAAIDVQGVQQTNREGTGGAQSRGCRDIGNGADVYGGIYFKEIEAFACNIIFDFVHPIDLFGLGVVYPDGRFEEMIMPF